MTKKPSTDFSRRNQGSAIFYRTGNDSEWRIAIGEWFFAGVGGRCFCRAKMAANGNGFDHPLKVSVYELKAA